MEDLAKSIENLTKTVRAMVVDLKTVTGMCKDFGNNSTILARI
jgi:hypothetical protein